MKTRISQISLHDDGIIRLVIHLQGAENGIEDAKENIAALTQIKGDKKRPLLIDARFQKSMDLHARTYYIKHSRKILTAVAVMNTSPMMAILTSFMIGLNKTINNEKLPIKLFTSEDKAIDWLNMYHN